MHKETLTAVARAAREAAARRHSDSAWDYDTLKNAANYAAASALEDFAERLDALNE